MKVFGRGFRTINFLYLCWVNFGCLGVFLLQVLMLEVASVSLSFFFLEDGYAGVILLPFV